jgi:hypothetical protein
MQPRCRPEAIRLSKNRATSVMFPAARNRGRMLVFELEMSDGVSAPRVNFSLRYQISRTPQRFPVHLPSDFQRVVAYKACI